MSKYTRGEFLGFGAALAGAFGVGRMPMPQSEQPSAAATAADLVVVNANVYTSEASQPRAEAFAIKNGRFVESVEGVDHRPSERIRLVRLASVLVGIPASSVPFRRIRPRFNHAQQSGDRRGVTSPVFLRNLPPGCSHQPS